MSAERTVNTQNECWVTPPKYVLATKHFFGSFIALDTCSNEYSVLDAKTELN